MNLQARINNSFDGRFVVTLHLGSSDQAQQTRIFNSRKELSDDIGKLSYWVNLTVIDQTI